MQKYLFLCISFLLLNTNSKAQSIDTKKEAIISDQLKWSERMALSIIKTYPEAWQIDNHPAPKWDYKIGMILTAYEKLYKKTNDPKYFDYIKGYADKLIDEKGAFQNFDSKDHNIDFINAGKILFNLYDTSKEQKYLTALQTLRRQFDDHPRTPSGGFWHKKIYPNQMWLDGLYMGEPFYAEYTVTFENGAKLDDVAHEFELIQEKATDKKTGLLYHAWDESKEMPWANKETGVSPNFWSRSMGWYVMGLVDVLDYFPKNYPKRKELILYLNNISNALVKFQDPSGLWYQVTDMGTREGNYLETSGTAMFAYAFVKGAKKGYLPKKFKKIAEKAFDGMTSRFVKVYPNGEIEITNACAVAGLGGKPYRDGSYEYYIKERRKDNDPKVTGPFILAALELNR